MKTNADSPGTIESYLLHTARMGDGSGKQERVIVNGFVMEYLGFGWFQLREASEEDFLTYPTVVFPQTKKKRKKSNLPVAGESCWS